MKLWQQRIWQRAASLLLALALPVGLYGHSKPKRRPTAAQQKCATAGQCLSLALFTYNSDDISDAAVKQFQDVLKRFAGTQEAETAQYYLAGYYQRKFYIQRERLHKEDSGLLETARAQYFIYIDKYSTAGKGLWLTDAHFNIALAAIQLQDRDGARVILERMLRAESRDQKTYVYQIVWSISPGDVVDAYLPAKDLAYYMLSLVNKGQTAEQIIPALRRWCQGQKSLKY